MSILAAVTVNLPADSNTPFEYTIGMIVVIQLSIIIGILWARR